MISGLPANFVRNRTGKILRFTGKENLDQGKAECLLGRCQAGPLWAKS
jgi:hypothetical protein